MPKKASNVDIWIKRETSHIRKALENASSYFDNKDKFNVNTLEAIYAQESSFGKLKRIRGAKVAAGEFHLEVATAKRYGLTVTKENDQRFDIDYASIAAARYLKYLDHSFSKETDLGSGKKTIPINNVLERKKFAFAAYNAGEGTIAKAQYLAQQAGKDPTNWDEVQKFLEEATTDPKKPTETRRYVQNVFKNEAEFAEKSPADKKSKDKKIGGTKIQCTTGHWITKNHLHIFICH